MRTSGRLWGTVLVAAHLLTAVGVPDRVCAQPSLTVPEDPDSRGEEPTDDEVARWATQELREHGLAHGSPATTPVPPATYVENNAEAPPATSHRAPSSHDEERILAEVGGGLAGALVGGGAGAFLMWALVDANADPHVLTGAGIAAGTLAAVAIAAGVALSADAAGGQGNFGYALIGQMIGALIAIPIAVLALDNDLIGAAMAATGILSVGGAIVAYEISHANAPLSGSSAFIAPTRDGILVGAAGAM